MPGITWPATPDLRLDEVSRWFLGVRPEAWDVSVAWARCARSQWPAIEIFGSSSGMSANRSFDLRS